MKPKNAAVKEKIRVALRGQSTGLIAGDIRERGGIAEGAACMAALMQMKRAGEVAAHEGETARSTRYSLNPEFVAETSAGGGRKRKAPKKKPGRKVRKAREARQVRPIAAEPDFVPALTADYALVLVEGESARRFTPEQTLAIATLVMANFD